MMKTFFFLYNLYKFLLHDGEEKRVSITGYFSSEREIEFEDHWRGV